MDEILEKARARSREIASEFAERGDAVGWFDALYAEADGDPTKIPWADLEPNRFLKEWAESVGLAGRGRSALVIGCGLGDDARYLYDRGFKVSAFDISETAIKWARRLHADTDIKFATADLFDTPSEWRRAFDFVLEVYTIQPLPLSMRADVIRSIAGFVGDGGELVVVTRGRDDDEIPDQLPWALSPKDLAEFEKEGLEQSDFRVMWGDEDEPLRRFVVVYKRPVQASRG